ncbi:MAG TPA: D-Ala-D-Ala carboxypeptidase family metallohydrolase [Gemmatimonadales bacterium]|nr:D-Ala-D-Ala carboxypeptidase family metallohydrolase [Gemmatimonadales bacterium]
MKPALVAALLGAISLSVTEDYRRPAPPKDPHDTVVVTPDSALVPKAPVRATLPGRVSFAVKFKEEVSPFPIMGMFVMPGEQVPLEAVLTDSTARYTARAAAGRIARLGANRWRWTAPEKKGLYPVWVRDSASGETVTLNAFVLVPMPTAATIGGFMVGRYESRPLRGNPTYARPTGFVEVTEENRGTLVAPHFTIGQFVSKQSGGYPKYLVLRERLLLKLEMLLEEVRSAGMTATTFRVMSGYRTPFYNRSIGNETRYSRHVYGDAADIYVDDDADGVMDDLDGDGKTTLDDARALGGVIESLSGKSWYQPFEGGLGLYKANRAHGPFVHVDVRGHPARWGP